MKTKILLLTFLCLFTACHKKGPKIMTSDEYYCMKSRIWADSIIKKNHSIATNVANQDVEFWLIEKYGIVVYYVNDCAQHILDSALFTKYGRYFYKKVEREVDSVKKVDPKYFENIGIGIFIPPKYPSYPGGTEILDSIVSSKIHRNIRKLLNRELIVLIIGIDRVGNITSVKVKKHVRPYIDDIIVKAIWNLPKKWIPGTDSTMEKVSYRYVYKYVF